MSQLEALLNGINHLEPVDLSAVGGPASVLVRPLGSAEAAQVERLMFQGMSAEVNLGGAAATALPAVTDFSGLLEGQKLAQMKAVEFGLSHSGDTCTGEQAARIPATWVDALSQAIFRISGIRTDVEDSFRGPAGMDGAGADGGAGDAAALPERGATSPDPGGVDPVTA